MTCPLAYSFSVKCIHVINGISALGADCFKRSTPFVIPIGSFFFLAMAFLYVFSVKSRFVKLSIPFANSENNKKDHFLLILSKLPTFYGGEGGIRPPAGGPPRVARRPRRLAKCPRFESLHAVKTNIPHPLVRDVCFWKRYRVLIEKRLRGCTACLGGCISI